MTRWIIEMLDWLFAELAGLVLPSPSLTYQCRCCGQIANFAEEINDHVTIELVRDGQLRMRSRKHIAYELTCQTCGQNRWRKV